MLRIGNAAPPQGPETPPLPPPPGALPPNAPQIDGPSIAPPTGAPETTTPKTLHYKPQASQAAAGYMGPDMGPFACGNCRHYEDGGKCDIVEGQIDPAGNCNLFESAQAQDHGGGPDDSILPPEGLDGPPEAPPPALKA